MATLATGAPMSVHGIHGYREAARPREARSALETETGFDARRLRAEPLWTAAARAGRSAVLAFAPLASPHEVYARGAPWGPRGERGSIETFDGYSSVLAGQAVHRAADSERTGGAFRIVLPFAERPVELLLRPGEERASLEVVGGERVELVRGRAVSVVLHGNAGAAFVLFDVGRDDFTLWRSGVWELRSSIAGVASALIREVGPFVGSGAGHACREGLLGPTLREGGDGLAEERYRETLEASSRFFRRASAHVLERHPADVTVLYEPCIDETAHLFQDLVEQGDGRALGLLRAAYRMADDHLGAVLDRAGDDAIVAIGSDHGQQGVKRVFRPNVVLHEAGLLGVDSSGHVELERTRVLYGLAANGFLLVNKDSSPRGIVPASEVARVVRRALALLLEQKDVDGKPFLVAAHLAGEETSRGRAPGDDAGDAVLLAAPGVALGTGAVGSASEAAHGGQHTSALDEPALDALFAVAGPGVPALGRIAERVENAQVAPTLARLLGVPRPESATLAPIFG
jgi:hypothetical protein